MVTPGSAEHLSSHCGRPQGSFTITSADIIQQALNLALIEELCVSQVAMPFGSGIRYFGELIAGHVTLENPVVLEGTRALHLRYPGRHWTGVCT